MQVAREVATGRVYALRFQTTRRRLPARVLVGGLSLFAGIVHLALAGPHFAEATWLGTAFVVDGAGLAAAGLWVLLTGTTRARRAAGVIATLTAFAYVGSRTIGLPGMDREVWDGLGLATTFAELVVAVPWRFPERTSKQLAYRSDFMSDGRRDA